MDGTWTITELAEHAAAALAADGSAQVSGRVRDLPNERLIRWYTTIGLVDPPLGRRGRTALYGPRHLLQLVAVKRRQAIGRSIAEIQVELAAATDATLERIAALPSRPPSAPPPRPIPGSGRSPHHATESVRGPVRRTGPPHEPSARTSATEGSARKAARAQRLLPTQPPGSPADPAASSPAPASASPVPADASPDPVDAAPDPDDASPDPAGASPYPAVGSQAGSATPTAPEPDDAEPATAPSVSRPVGPSGSTTDSSDPTAATADSMATDGEVAGLADSPSQSAHLTSASTNTRGSESEPAAPRNSTGGPTNHTVVSGSPADPEETTDRESETSRGTFWSTRPDVSYSQATVAGGHHTPLPPVVQGVRLASGLTLLVDVPALSGDDLAAIENAARPLLEALHRRGLLTPAESLATPSADPSRRSQ